jgi:hypothetical protein
MSREVEYGIKVTAVDGLTPPVAKATESVKKLETAINGAALTSSKSFTSITSAARSIVPVLGATGVAAGAVAVSLGLAASAATRAVGVMFDLAGAASKVEQLEIRTAAAIRSKTDLTDEEFASLQRLNAERERQLGIDADAQLQAQGTLAAMGVRKEALDLATKATIGLSNATGQGLNEAARVVAKVLAGNTAALQEYGMKVSSVEEAQQKFVGLFDIVAAKSGTYGTKIEALRHSWDGLGEAFGKLIISNPDVMRTLDSILGGINSLTKATEAGGKSARGYQQIISTVFKAIGTGAMASAQLISNAIRALNVLFRSPNLMRLSKDLEGSIREMQNIMAGGTGREVETANQAAAESYIEAGKALAFYQREQKAALAAGDVDAILAINQAIAEQTGKIRSLQEWAAKSQGGLRGLMSAVEELGREEVSLAAPKVASAAGDKSGADAAKKAADELRDQRRRSEEADADMMLDITEWVVKQRNAAVESGLKKEQEARDQAAKQAAEVERAKLDAVRRRIEAQQQAEEAAKARAQQTFEELVSFFEGVGQNLVGIFSDAFSIIGGLQNKTTTEIVRNERGQLEERTRITEQYVATAGDALAKFLGDAGQMFAKAALNFIAIKAVEAAVAAIASAVGTFGLLGLVVAGGAAAVATALVAANKAKIPPPPKFFTGGVVPGPMGAPRLAMVEGGERVTSVADRVDGRGSGNATVVINNNLLAAPSRVQMERVNRDTVMPSMRRLQRLGFAT